MQYMYILDEHLYSCFVFYYTVIMKRSPNYMDKLEVRIKHHLLKDLFLKRATDLQPVSIVIQIGEISRGHKTTILNFIVMEKRF